jgi:ribosomal protein S18 acetylase RimI-like enzyme
VTYDIETPIAPAAARQLEVREDTLRCLQLSFYDGDEKVGSAQLHASHASCLEIISLAVEPERRGQGHGKQILEQLKAIARSMGATEMCAHTSPDNVAAYRLFAGHGFHVCESEAHLELTL